MPLTVRPGPLTAQELMDWAEAQFPDLFPSWYAQTGTLGATVAYRSYPDTKNVLGVSDEGSFQGIYVFGAVTGYQLRFMGTLADYKCIVRNPCEPPSNTPKLLFSEIGVALTSTPSWSRLSRTIAVRNTGASQAGWTAASDQPWLSVTASGSTAAGGTTAFTLSANASGLQTGKVTLATVTLTPSNGTVASPEKLVVGVWKGASTPSEVVLVPKRYLVGAVDPVRPYVYVHARDSRIDIYNVYTRELEGSIADVGGVLGGMAVASDGSALYALDGANGTIAEVDLKTRTLRATHAPELVPPEWAGLAYARPDGKGLLFVSNGSVYDAASMNPVARIQGGDLAVTVSPDGTRVAYGAGGGGISVFSIAVQGDGLYSERLGNAQGTNGRDLAFALDSSRVYTASGYPYRCESWDRNDASAFGALPVEPYPNNVEVASDGRVYCGVDAAGTPDVWVFSAKGVLLKTLQFVSSQGDMAGMLPRQFHVSSDGLMGFAIVHDDYYDRDHSIAFIPVGP